MTEIQPPSIQQNDGSPSIVIAGGGISGMYCAYKLGEKGHHVFLLEASPDRWGGRIETVDMERFIAEYGPMRFEPHLQPKFHKLIQGLGIEYKDFVGPEAEEIDFPKYKLEGDEKGLNALQLLRRGVLLIMKQDPNDEDGSQRWIDDQTEDTYQVMREKAELNDTPLRDMGFWNALSAEGVLSHQALMKIRDTGTFYHMIPDNLNAIEWTIWWLRALKTEGQSLKSLKGGTAELTRQLSIKLGEDQKHVILVPGAELLSFRAGAKDPNIVEFTYRLDNKVATEEASNLILAMPQAPLFKLADSLPPEIRPLLDTVNGFPMVKVFFVTNDPWWEPDQPPQTRANRMPTREVHYFRRPKDDDPDGYGMVLIYTDRPATEYWNLYVSKKLHDRAEIKGNDKLKEQFARFMAKDVQDALDHQENPSFGLQLTDKAQNKFKELTFDECAQRIEDSVVTYGIRDWARPPYGAANHSWRPGVKSWEVQEHLRAFALGQNAPKNVHICGEAYSNYSGFIEGALNSAELVLSAIVFQSVES